jgi:hypothetical protein
MLTRMGGRCVVRPQDVHRDGSTNAQWSENTKVGQHDYPLEKVKLVGRVMADFAFDPRQAVYAINSFPENAGKSTNSIKPE